MHIRLLAALLLLLCSLPAANGGRRRDAAPDISRLPRTITTRSGVRSHVQGIAVDIKRGVMYFSYTTMLLKTDLRGNVVGSVDGFVGHLGCITCCEADGRVYGSLEYKNDEIGRGLRSVSADVADKDSLERATTGFYVAMFDGARITRPHMSPEEAGVMGTVFIREAYDDYFATPVCGGRTVKHHFGCSGLDGTTVAPAIGKRGKADRIYLAYGVYADKERADNDYQVILSYNLRKLARYAKPLTQSDLHRSGPLKPEHKYFVRTGNTTYGVQNLTYDSSSRRFYMAVYKGIKPEFPNFSHFAVDATIAPRRETLVGVEPAQQGEVLTLASSGATTTGGGATTTSSGATAAGISGWNFPHGACGLCPIGGGYFYIAENFAYDGGLQGCTARLYRWTGDAATPFAAVE